MSSAPTKTDADIVDSLSDEAAPPSVDTCRDPLFGVLFFAHFVVLCFLAYVGTTLVSQALTVLNSLPGSELATAAAIDNANALSQRIDPRALVAAVGVAVGAAAVSSAATLCLLQHAGGLLIRACFYVAIFGQLVCGAALLAYASIPAGIVLLCLGTFTFIYYLCVRGRIAFAAAHVEVASAAMRNSPTIFGVGLLALLAQAIWSVTWGLAAAGAGTYINSTSNSTATFAIVDPMPQLSSSDSGRITLIFLLLLSFFWVSTFIHDVVSFTAAATTGDWWYKGEAERHPVRHALCRAVTTSCGTLAFSSLIVATVKAARKLYELYLRQAKKSGELARNPLLQALACLGCIVLCCLERIVNFANEWAVVMAALRGGSFLSSGSSAWTLFKHRGWDLVVNSSLINTALVAASLLGAALGALAGGAACYAVLGDVTANRALQAGVAATMCFFIGLFMTSVITAIVLSSTRAVFVAFASAPAALLRTHPTHAIQLAKAWAEFHPNEWQQSGFAAKFGGALSPAGEFSSTGAAKGAALTSDTGSHVVTNVVFRGGPMNAQSV